MKQYSYKRLLLSIALFLNIFAIANSAKASHCVGVDLYYDYLGANQYRIYLAFYMDCAGATANPGGCTYTILANCNPTSWGYSCNAPGTVALQYRSAAGNSCGQATVTAQPIITDITPVCPGQQSDCSGGGVPGVEQWLYTYDLTLPSAQKDWIITYSSYARNAGITTINNPGGVGINVETGIDNTIGPNSSPRFKNLPVPFVCVNNQFCYNNGAVEPNGTDSLSYSQVKPMVDIAAAPVVYKAGYSEFQPVKSTPAVTFDNTTGTFCMFPTQQDITVFAIKVKEYRKIGGVWKQIGFVTRDFQVRVINCPNNKPPTLNPTPNKGGNSLNGYEYEICAGIQTCFDVPASDPDAANKLTMSWNNGIPAATFTITGNNTAAPSGKFCWTPTLADVKAMPYNFAVTIKDDGCPYDAIQSAAFKVYVKDCSVTPIELLSFIGTAIEDVIKLSWITASEKNSQSFFIQRSRDGRVFENINQQLAGGNSNTNITYSYIDRTPFAGINYYRLIQVDLDGKAAISPAIAVRAKGKRVTIHGIYPNPAKENINIALQSTESGILKMQVFDICGKLLLQEDRQVVQDLNEISVNISALSPGLYFLRAVLGEDGMMTQQKFIKEDE
jgi:hypothetical protein